MIGEQDNGQKWSDDVVDWDGTPRMQGDVARRELVHNTGWKGDHVKHMHLSKIVIL